MSAAPPGPRRILLVDADAFFVAVARLVDPEGAGKSPLLIVGGAAGSRGVVLAAGSGRKKYGKKRFQGLAAKGCKSGCGGGEGNPFHKAIRA